MGISHEDRPYISRREFLQRTGALGGAAVITTAAGPLFWQQPAYAADAPVSHLHLQYGGDAAREAIVSWRTTAPVKSPFVEIAGSRVRATTRQYSGYANGWSTRPGCGACTPRRRTATAWGMPGGPSRATA